MNNIIPLRAFRNNYIWALHSPDHCRLTIVDPGDPTPVLSYLNKNNLKLSAILITHHHHDHIAGLSELCQRFQGVIVYGPENEAIPEITSPVSEGMSVSLWEGQALKIMEIPGHTRDHVAYYDDKIIFCGDTLFSSGCGRLFEGTAEQLYASLEKINQLDGNTLIYCAHEYTLANLRFAQLVDPNNASIQERIHTVLQQQQRKEPSLPVTLNIERATNPFLRCHTAAIKQAVEMHFQAQFESPLAVFAALRRWKDQF